MAVRSRKQHLALVGDDAPVPRRATASTISAPPELCDDARQEWDRILPQLLQAKAMLPVDRAMLAAYCQAYGRWVKAERALAGMAENDPLTSGLMVRTTSGNAVQNPLVGTANKAMADMHRYAVEFGLTPSARSKWGGVGDTPDW